MPFHAKGSPRPVHTRRDAPSKGTRAACTGLVNSLDCKTFPSHGWIPFPGIRGNSRGEIAACIARYVDAVLRLVKAVEPDGFIESEDNADTSSVRRRP